MRTPGPGTTTLLARGTAAAALAAALLLSPAAQADWYFGAKAGPVMVDGTGSDPTNAGVLVGHEWGVVAGDLGIEAELTRTIDDGRFAGQDLEVDTRGLYASFRTAGPVYLIARAGRVRSKVEVGGSGSSDTENAFGAGLGFSLGVAQIEIEYTRLHDNVDFVSLGLRF